MWPQRVWPKIAETLECEIDVLNKRYEAALDRYYSRPNGPGVRLQGLYETTFPTPEYDIEEA